MLIIQGLLSLIKRSMGRVFQSIFGWAVYVLFGAVNKDEKTLLAGAVASAAVWPILVAGAVVPRVAAFVLALVPLPESTPAGLLRTVWIVLALAVPVFVGWVIHKRSERRFSVRSALTAVPITLGIAAAFLVAFFVVPMQKLAALIRGEKTDLVPLIVEGKDRDEVADAVHEALGAAGLEVEPREPPKLQKAISGILRATSVMAGVSDAARPLYYAGDRLKLTIHPNGADLRGRPTAVLRAHAVIAERATTLPALQTTDPEAQELEKRIRRAWPASASGEPNVRAVKALARELSVLDCPYDEWEIVYRQVLQLHLAMEGAPQLLAGVAARPTARADATRVAQLRRRAAREARSSGLRALGSTTNAVATLAQKLSREAFAAWRRGR